MPLSSISTAFLCVHFFILTFFFIPNARAQEGLSQKDAERFLKNIPVGKQMQYDEGIGPILVSIDGARIVPEEFNKNFYVVEVLIRPILTFAFSLESQQPKKLPVCVDPWAGYFDSYPKLGERALRVSLNRDKVQIWEDPILCGTDQSPRDCSRKDVNNREGIETFPASYRERCVRLSKVYPSPDETFASFQKSGGVVVRSNLFDGLLEFYRKKLSLTGEQKHTCSDYLKGKALPQQLWKVRKPNEQELNTAKQFMIKHLRPVQPDQNYLSYITDASSSADVWSQKVTVIEAQGERFLRFPVRKRVGEWVKHDELILIGVKGGGWKEFMAFEEGAGAPISDFDGDGLPEFGISKAYGENYLTKIFPKHEILTYLSSLDNCGVPKQVD